MLCTLMVYQFSLYSFDNKRIFIVIVIVISLQTLIDVNTYPCQD